MQSVSLVLIYFQQSSRGLTCIPSHTTVRAVRHTALPLNLNKSFSDNSLTYSLSFVPLVPSYMGEQSLSSYVTRVPSLQTRSIRADKTIGSRYSLIVHPFAPLPLRKFQRYYGFG